VFEDGGGDFSGLDYQRIGAALRLSINLHFQLFSQIAAHSKLPGSNTLEKPNQDEIKSTLWKNLGALWISVLKLQHIFLYLYICIFLYSYFCIFVYLHSIQCMRAVKRCTASATYSLSLSLSLSLVHL
jgi:hypothetical protein